MLKLQFKRLVAQQANHEIYTKDLLVLIDQYEHVENVMLLTDTQKKAILPYTKTNPDLEMTADDILNLLKLVCPNPVASLSAPTTRQPVLDTVRPRTSPPLKTNKSTPWKRRPSAVASSIQDRNDLNQILSSVPTSEDNNQQLIDNVGLLGTRDDNLFVLT